jgi:hypothetical protein
MFNRLPVIIKKQQIGNLVEMFFYPARLAAAATLLRAWTDVQERVLALLPRDADDSRRAGDPQRLRRTNVD